MKKTLQQRYEEACRNIAKHDQQAIAQFQALYEAYLAVGEPALAMNCYVQLAYAYYNFGQLKKMLQLTNDYEQLCAQHQTPIDRAMYYPLLSAQYSRIGNEERALHFQKEAVRYTEAALATKQSTEAITKYFSAAKLYAAKLTTVGQLHEAEAVLQHMAQYVKHVPSDNFNRPEYFAQRAFVAIQLQKRHEAAHFLTLLKQEPLLAKPHYIRGRGHVCVLQMALWALDERCMKQSERDEVATSWPMHSYKR